MVVGEDRYSTSDLFMMRDTYTKLGMSLSRQIKINVQEILHYNVSVHIQDSLMCPVIVNVTGK